MKVDLQKIRIAGLKKHYKILMQELHRKGSLHIIENKEFNKNDELDDHFGVFDLARIEFAIQFLENFELKKSKLDSVLSGGKLIIEENEAKKRLKAFSTESEKIINFCEETEEFFVRAKNEQKKIAQKQVLLKFLHSLDSSLNKTFDTKKTFTWIGSINLSNEKNILEKLSGISNLIDIKILYKDDKKVILRITVFEKLKSNISKILQEFNFTELDFDAELQEHFGQNPKEISKKLNQTYEELEQKTENLTNQTKEFAEKYLEDLRILFDYNAWKKRKNDIQKEIFYSTNIFAFEAWIPTEKFEKLEKWVKNSFVEEVSIEKSEIEKNEQVPSLIKNPIIFRSFEPIVDMFGLPQKNEIDPTCFISPFFLIFFGTCLSDVGYGLILVFVGLFFLIFGKFSQAAKDGIRLILFAGLFATVGGILFGSYFGMTPEQAPSFLVNEDKTMFLGQLFNPMSGSGPLTFLLIAVGMGAIQLLSGLLIDFFQKIYYKKYIDAFCDPLGWFFFVGSLILYGISEKIGFDKNLMSNFALGSALYLVITQSRTQKNWILKPFSGALSLFGITGYLSDLLSYSRLMALGLATGVVGGAMNLTAEILGGMMPHPVLGIILSIFVLIAGHSLNFALSLLGAFVHSGRLQFIEFFGKFYEGGASKFTPFERKKKYLLFKK